MFTAITGTRIPKIAEREFTIFEETIYCPGKSEAETEQLFRELMRAMHEVNSMDLMGIMQRGFDEAIERLLHGEMAKSPHLKKRRRKRVLPRTSPARPESGTIGD